MKKVILIVAALTLVVSGVAAVSAYEAHIVDVKAHVENALIVSQDKDVDFGIVFPQELLQEELYIGLSNSFMDGNQTRVSDLEYALYWTPKLISDHPGASDPDNDGFFEPISPFIVPSHEAGESPLDGTVASGVNPPSRFGPLPVPAGYDKFAWGHLDKNTDPSDIWHLKFNVPVFDQWFNPTTDPLGNYPFVLYLADNDYVVVSENFTAADGTVVTGPVPHADLGNNIKIQVYAYSYDIPN